MLHWPGLWLDDDVSIPFCLTSNLPEPGPPHGFGKHIDQVSAQNFETFEVVQKNSHCSQAVRID